MNNVSEYAIPSAWTAIILGVISGICFITHCVMQHMYKKEVLYINSGYVKVYERVPDTFTKRTFWVSKENITTDHITD